jgi:hypothetical protein
MLAASELHDNWQADMPKLRTLNMSHARYLGDGVYAQFDGYGIVLTTGHHDPVEASNAIVLEPEVVNAFVNYRVALVESLQRGEEREQL